MSKTLLKLPVPLASLFAILAVVAGCTFSVSPPPTTPLPLPTTAPIPTFTLTTPPPPPEPEPTPTQAVALPDFVSVVSRVKPSVVAIDTESSGFFNQTQTGAGSGWILDREGLIATNNHVIEGARSITVTFDDGSAAPATVVGADDISDLAVLKVDRNGLQAATLGDSSKLKVGEWVVAIGNALGEGISASDGIVSRLGVSIDISAGQTLFDLIQTTAAINPGNSGGPLVNMAGEVIGITSAKLAAVGIEGMGYAISVSTARPIIESLVQRGFVVRPYLGVQLADVDPFMVLRYNLSVDSGAFVTRIVSGSPADTAGVRAGDVIVGMDGKAIIGAQQAVQTIRSFQVGGQLRIIYVRGAERQETTALLVESPPSP